MTIPTVKWKPYPTYKDSGVEWLGPIPAHWEIKRLKYVAVLNPNVLAEDTDPDYGISYVDITGVDSSGRITGAEDLRFEAAPSRARRRVQDGDTILSTVRTYLKAIAFMESPPENLVVSQIIKELNERFGTDFSDEDKVFILQLEEKLAGDPALSASVRVNTPENARLTFDYVVNDRLQDMIETNFKFYKRITDDQEFAKFFLDWLFERFRSRIVDSS